MRAGLKFVSSQERTDGIYAPVRQVGRSHGAGATWRINRGPRGMNSASARKGTKFVGVHFQPEKLSEKQGSAEIIPLLAHVPAKVLAQATGRSVETSKGWKSGRAFLNGASLINLARSFPEVRNWVIEQCGGDAGPNAAALIGSAILKLASQPTPQGELARQALQLVGGGE